MTKINFLTLLIIVLSDIKGVIVKEKLILFFSMNSFSSLFFN